MSLKFVAHLAVAEVNFSVEGDSATALLDAIAELRAGARNGAPAGAANSTGPAAAAADPAKESGKKSVKAEKPAASSQPAAETPKEGTSASAKKEDAPASTYEKTGFADKIAGYLGVKETEGYAERRAKLVALLTSFNVKKGPDLTVEQFAPFGVALDALLAAPAAEEDLG